MQKKATVTLALVFLMVVLCAACGKTEDVTEAAAPVVVTTAEPVQAAEMPMVTAEPNRPETVDTAAAIEYISEAQRVAADLEGENIEELYAVIGEPLFSAYGASCNGDGEDGTLYYDGFIVSSYRDTDGTETVMGTWSMVTNTGSAS